MELSPAALLFMFTEVISAGDIAMTTGASSSTPDSGPANSSAVQAPNIQMMKNIIISLIVFIFPPFVYS